MANITVNDISLLTYAADFLDPFGRMLGMDGYIIMAFILGLPANEIVIPIIIMSYMASGTMLELDELEDLRQLLVANGWTWLTGLCVMLFSLMHFPCGTPLDYKKETQSKMDVCILCHTHNSWYCSMLYCSKRSTSSWICLACFIMKNVNKPEV